MSMKSCKLYPLTIVVVGMMLAAFLAAPICYAGGAVTLVPADDREVPAGSFIPEQRIKKIEIKVEKFKAEMKQKADKQQRDRSSQDETPTPENPKEK